jgi:hypothetical protein
VRGTSVLPREQPLRWWEALLRVSHDITLDPIRLCMIAQPVLSGGGIIAAGGRREAIPGGDAKPLEKLRGSRAQRAEIGTRLPVGVGKGLQDQLAFIGIDRLLFRLYRTAERAISVDQ